MRGAPRRPPAAGFGALGAGAAALGGGGAARSTGAAGPPGRVTVRFFSTTTALVRPWLKLCLTVPVSLAGRFTPSGARGGAPALKVFPVWSLLSVINRLIS